MAGRLYSLGIFIGFALIAAGALAARAHIMGLRGAQGAALPQAQRPVAAMPSENATEAQRDPPAVQDEAVKVPPAPGPVPPKPSPKRAADKAGELPADRSVDINTASASQLQLLPGIGPVMANRIVSYRNQHGRFSSVDGLDEVKGIGPKTLDKLRKYIYVSE
jgi:competence protein ComEA